MRATMAAVGAAMLAGAAAGQNQVLLLDAFGRHVSIPHNSSQSTTTAITVEYWARIDQYSGRPVHKRSGSAGQFNMTVGTDCRPDPMRWGLELHGVASIGMEGCLPLPPQQFHPLLFGLWNHYAVTWSAASRRVRLYVNGVIVGETVAASNGMVQTQDPLCFGDIGVWWNHDFRGRLDNIRLWSIERSQAEIASSAMTTFTPEQAASAQGLIGSWSFDDGAATDATGRNSGTLMNGASIVADAAVYAVADCNSDGVLDAYQLAVGELSDANNNGIPDVSVNILRQPTDAAVEVDQPVYFSVELEPQPACTTPVAFRWQRRNPIVADDAAPNAWIDLQDGAGFVNTGTASMTIQRPVPGLATGYRCKITGGCGCESAAEGVAYTNTVNFSVACPSDFNADGGVDFGDIQAFFERWENGC